MFSRWRITLMAAGSFWSLCMFAQAYAPHTDLGQPLHTALGDPAGPDGWYNRDGFIGIDGRLGYEEGFSSLGEEAWQVDHWVGAAQIGSAEHGTAENFDVANVANKPGKPDVFGKTGFLAPRNPPKPACENRPLVLVTFDLEQVDEHVAQGQQLAERLNGLDCESIQPPSVSSSGSLDWTEDDGQMNNSIQGTGLDSNWSCCSPDQTVEDWAEGNWASGIPLNVPIQGAAWIGRRAYDVVVWTGTFVQWADTLTWQSGGVVVR